MGARTTYFFKLEPIHHFGREFDSQAGGSLPIIKAVLHNRGKFQLHLWKIPLPKPGGGGDHISSHAGPHRSSCRTLPFHFGREFELQAGQNLPIIKAPPILKGNSCSLPKPWGGGGPGPHTLQCWSPSFTLAGSLISWDQFFGISL